MEIVNPEILERPSLDIFTPWGEEAIFSYPNAGYLSDIEKAKKYGLKEGMVYIIDEIKIGGWDSVVYLEEFPNVPFNTVQFTNAPNYRRAGKI